MVITRKAWYALLILSALVALLYLPGLSGSFNFDDDGNITSNPLLRVYVLEPQALAEAAASGYAGPLGRPLAMLSFALDHYISQGFNPHAMKFTNLLIHISCGIALYLLTQFLISRSLALDYLRSDQPENVAIWAPVLIAFLWMVHPANLTPVLYVVQRMTSLSALFCALGMVCYVYGRERLELSQKHAYTLISAAYLVCLPLAVLSKENGALLVVYLLILELAFFNHTPSSRKPLAAQQKQQLVSLHIGLVVVPIALFLLYVSTNPGFILNAYRIRDFSLWERILTESRVLFLYLRFTFKPLISEMALFHDYFQISRGLVAPPSTIMAIIALTATVISAWIWRARWPLYTFAVAFFLIAHSMESSIIGLELIHEHRNYLASWALMFLIVCCLASLGRTRTGRTLMYTAILTFVLLLSFQTWHRATIWGNQFLHAMDEVDNHPDSPRANYQAGRVYAFLANAEEDPDIKAEHIQQVLKFFRQSAAMERNNTDAMFGLLMLSAIEGVELEELEVQQMMSRFAEPPFPPNSYNYLQSMFKCIAENACRISRERVDGIIEASTANPGYGGMPAELVMAAYQRYLLDQELLQSGR